MPGRRDIQAGRAYVELYVKNKAFIRGLRSAQQRLTSFGTGMKTFGLGMMAGGAAIGGPLALMVKGFMSVGDSLDKMSSRVGASVEFLSALSHAAQIGGTDISAMEVGIRRLQRTAYDAARGLSTATDAFADLGIGVLDANGQLKSTEQLFMESAAALSRLENNTKKAALATVIFGRAGTSVLPMLQDGASGLKAVMQEARDLGIVISTENATAAAKLTDAWTRLLSTLKAAAFHIGGALAPVLEMVADAIVPITTNLIAWVKQNDGLIITIAAVAAGLMVAGAAFVTAGVSSMLLGSMFGVAATAAGALMAVLSAILSPIGLIVVGLTSLTAYFLVASGVWRDVAGWIADGFAILKEDAIAAFGGITDAIMAGDMELATNILWAAMKLEWQRGINWLEGLWEDFKSFFSTNNLALIFVEATGKIRTIWAEMLGSMEKTWTKFNNSVFVEEYMKNLATMYAYIKGDNPKEIVERIAYNAQKRRNTAPSATKIDAETAAKKAKIEAETQAAADQLLQDMAPGAKARTQKEQVAAAALAKAKAELAALTEEAAGKAAKAQRDRFSGGRPQMSEMPESPGLPSESSLKRTAVGTFSAAQAALYGGGRSQGVFGQMLTKLTEIARTAATQEDINRDTLDEQKRLTLETTA